MEILSSTNVILQSVINRQAEMEASVRASQQEQKLPLVAISDLKKINIETNPVSYGDPILNQYGISTSTGAMTGSPHSGVLCPNPINRTKCTSMS
jgi:hypothetical protein